MSEALQGERRRPKNSVETGIFRGGGHRDRAFTLIELLIAVAIIGVLAALLVPGLARAKDQGRKAACINNVKQLQLAWQMYCDDNNDVLPINNDSAPTTGVGGDLAWVGGWMAPINETAPQLDNTNILLLIKVAGGIGQYLNEPKVFKCPSDRSQTRIKSILYPRVRSFAMNNFLSGDLRANLSLSGYGKLSALAALPPVETGWVFTDTHEDSIGPGYFLVQSPDVKPTAWDHFPANRHGGASVSFVDGHIVCHRWGDDRTKQPITGYSLYGGVQPGNPDCKWLV